MILQQQEIKLLCDKDNRIFWTSTTTFTSCLVFTIHGQIPLILNGSGYPYLTYVLRTKLMDHTLYFCFQCQASSLSTNTIEKPSALSTALK